MFISSLCCAEYHFIGGLVEYSLSLKGLGGSHPQINIKRSGLFFNFE